MSRFDQSISHDMVAAALAKMQPSSKAFSDEERKEILEWKHAALFYDQEFTSLANRRSATTWKP